MNSPTATAQQREPRERGVLTIHQPEQEELRKISVAEIMASISAIPLEDQHEKQDEDSDDHDAKRSKVSTPNSASRRPQMCKRVRYRWHSLLPCSVGFREKDTRASFQRLDDQAPLSFHF